MDGQLATLTTARVNDGLWHRIDVTWLTGGGVRLSLDYGKRHVTKMLNAKVQGLYIGKVTLGKLEDSKMETDKLQGFGGCIQVKTGNTRTVIWPMTRIHPNFKRFCFSQDVRIGSSQTLQRPTEISKVNEGCGVTNPCTSGKCPRHSDCIATWEKYTCQCHTGKLESFDWFEISWEERNGKFYSDLIAGYVGPSCSHVCETNPCENGAHCVEDTESPRGYKCVCNSEQYRGK